MKRYYQRSKIYSYNDLSEEQQRIAYENDNENCFQSNFVLWNNEPLSLNDFIATPESKFWWGNMMLTAFSGYLIKLSKTYTEATVVYGHW